jgi:nucleoid-associated protein YgaU
MAKMTKTLVPVFLVLLLLAVGCAKKPPTLESISPSSGISGGGDKVTITIAEKGKKFKEGATVKIGGVLLKSLVISEDGTSVTGVTPGGKPGSQQVIGANLKAKEESAAITFTYIGLEVTNTVPADGTALPWMPRTTQASATFSQNTSSASIAIDGIAGSSNYDASSKTVTFTASAPLRTTQSYTVTVSGAKDAAGNVLADYKFGFSIGEPEKIDWYTIQEADIQGADTLRVIAAKPEIYEDESQWMTIYEINQDEYLSADGQHGNDIILDYKNLKPGMDLYIPR